MFPLYFWIIVWGSVVILILTTLMFLRAYKKFHFECPKCGERFQVKSFGKFVVTVHANNDMYVKCPKCGDKEFMTLIKGKLEDGENTENEKNT